MEVTIPPRSRSPYDDRRIDGKPTGSETRACNIYELLAAWPRRESPQPASRPPPAVAGYRNSIYKEYHSAIMAYHNRRVETRPPSDPAGDTETLPAGDLAHGDFYVRDDCGDQARSLKVCLIVDSTWEMRTKICIRNVRSKGPFYFVTWKERHLLWFFSWQSKKDI